MVHKAEGFSRELGEEATHQHLVFSFLSGRGISLRATQSATKISRTHKPDFEDATPHTLPST